MVRKTARKERIAGTPKRGSDPTAMAHDAPQKRLRVSWTRTVMLLLIVVCAGVIGATGASLIYHSWYIIDVQTKDVTFTVADGPHIGFDLNRTALTFGKVPHPGQATRRTTLSSTIPAYAYIRVSPSIDGWVVPDQWVVDLSNDSDHYSSQVTFNLFVPADATPGRYNGTVTVTYVRKMLWQ